MNTEPLQHAENQMLMRRPWEVADPESLWEITGRYPGGEGSFEDCLAITLPRHVTGQERPLFVFVGALGGIGAVAALNRPVDPAWVTHAVPLLLVHRDDPNTPYWESDRPWMEARHD